MGLTLLNSSNSFVRFGDPDSFTHCVFGEVAYYLPVFASDDVHFQFIISTDTSSEGDALCTIDGSEVLVELISSCGDVEPLIEFTEKPGRVRLSPTQVLYNWQQGFAGWPGPIVGGQCFRIRVTVSTNYGDLIQCSNIFQRITDDCFTSLLEYGNEDDAFGFKYCNGGAVDTGGAAAVCEPTTIPFFNESTLSIPYTAMLQDQYGLVPSIQVYIYNESGVLVNMGITATMDAVPPTVISFDFGGPASGVIILR